MNDNDILLVSQAYSKEDLARKYLSAQAEVIHLEREKKELIKELFQLQRKLSEVKRNEPDRC